MPKILVSIINYCDPEFEATVKSFWENADNPDDILFSLIDQDVKEKEFPYLKEVNYKFFHIADHYKSIGWARHEATQVDFEYDYFLQLDGHMLASKGWDTTAIANLCKLPKKSVIAYAPPDFYYTYENKLVIETEKFGISAQYYDEVVPGYTFPGYWSLEKDQIKKCYWTTCMFLFTPRAWVEEVGIDPNAVFNTEEFDLSIRTFAAGWSVFSIGSNLAFHLLHTSRNRNIVKTIHRPWGDGNEERYWSSVRLATNQLGQTLKGNEKIPLSKVIEFFMTTGIPLDRLDFKGDYYELQGSTPKPVKPGQSQGMPPRHLA